jgi:thiol-disulfide isomerase/thioredoxin
MKAEQFADHAGKIVVLEFWSIGCRPCQKLIAELQDLPAKYPEWKDKLIVIAVNVDDDKDAAIKHLKANGWDKTHNVWVDSEALKAFHVQGLPTIYVVDQTGSVAAADPEKDISATIDRLIEGK